MRPKQKKLSRLTDMLATVRRIREDQFLALQKSRLDKCHLYPTIVKEESEIRAVQKLQGKAITRRKKRPSLGAFWSGLKENLRGKGKWFARQKNAVSFSFQHHEINLLPPKSKRNFFPRPGLRLRTLPSLAQFLAVCLLLLSLIPVFAMIEKNRSTGAMVLGTATSAYEELKRAQSAFISSDFSAANASLEQAYRGFGAALNEFKKLNTFAANAPAAVEGQKLLLAAQQAVLALEYWAEGAESLLELRIGKEGIFTPLPGSRSCEVVEEWRINAKRPDGSRECKPRTTSLRGEPVVTGFISRAPDLASFLESSFRNFQTARQYLQDVEQMLNGVNIAGVSQEIRSQISQAKDLIESLKAPMTDFLRLEELFAGLADKQEKTYLLLFQNNRELRPTGGFIGTYGILQLQSGKIRNLKIDTVYNPDGQLKEAVAAPGPLQHKLSKHWAMRDSNWFFNFPDSARKAGYFLELETGIKTDGVVAFTPAVFQRLLRMTGPIHMPAYNVTLTSENFVDEVQYQTSVIYDRQLNQPKKFLEDFTPLLLDRLSGLDATGRMELLQTLLQSLAEKDMLLFSADPALQGRFENFNWAGQVRSASGDYLAVVNANVGAGKTDQNIRQKIELSAGITEDGIQTNKIVITREHTPGAEKEFPVNADYLRIFVPAGSALVSASGFDAVPHYSSADAGARTDPDLARLDLTAVVYPAYSIQVSVESGKTVFGGWVILPPGQTKQVSIEYRLPNSYNKTSNGPQSYSLLVQKQPGAPPTQFVSTLTLPPRYTLSRRYPENLVAEGQELRFESTVPSDVSWGAIFR